MVWHWSQCFQVCIPDPCDLEKCGCFSSCFNEGCHSLPSLICGDEILLPFHSSQSIWHLHLCLLPRLTLVRSHSVSLSFLSYKHPNPLFWSFNRALAISRDPPGDGPQCNAPPGWQGYGFWQKDPDFVAQLWPHDAFCVLDPQKSYSLFRKLESSRGTQKISFLAFI